MGVMKAFRRSQQKLFQVTFAVATLVKMVGIKLRRPGILFVTILRRGPNVSLNFLSHCLVTPVCCRCAFIRFGIHAIQAELLVVV